MHNLHEFAEPLTPPSSCRSSSHPWSSSLSLSRSLSHSAVRETPDHTKLLMLAEFRAVWCFASQQNLQEKTNKQTQHRSFTFLRAFPQL